ncbi:MAG: hydantoinase/oxoprolinase family protein [Acetobacteraceae bacterium]|jgi:N-methylhydantoinase A
MSTAHTAARLAVDIGGTFTDVALEHPGGRDTIKVLTTPAAPEVAVLYGVRSILETSGVAAADVGLIIHGTTLATNAVIERKGARTALVTTEGFRDVIEMGNESRYDQYDLNITLPEPLVPRSLRLPVSERLDNTGRVLKALDENNVRALVPKLKDEKIASIAVGLLHAFVNGEHERQVRKILNEELPDIPVSLSSEVSPEMREWERFSTTVANAYVQPMMARYLRRLEADLRAAGFTAPLFLMMSGGGLTTIDTACRFPIRLVESGPAGGAIFSAHISRECGLDRVLSFDMGGTTAKICLIDDYRPQTARAFEVARVGRFRKGSGLPLRIPVIEMVEIGAGGGSIAHVDTMARIEVGPASAGADPGPVCYGQGGTKPTVTDANLLLGRYDPLRFAGGTMKLDTMAARDALLTEVGAPLGLAPEMAALGVIEIVDENMANAARVHAIESGKTYEGRTLIAFGGGGPVHACRLAEKVGIRRILVPSGAGVGSAIGFLRAPVGYEVVRSLYQRLSTFDVSAVNTLLISMRDEAYAVVDQGRLGQPITETRIAFMRYVGQGHEIPVPLPTRMLSTGDVTEIHTAYEQEYSKFFDRPVPGSDVEVMSYAVVLTTATPDIEVAPQITSFSEAQSTQSRPVRDTSTGAASPWAVHDRTALTTGSRIPGPAIIFEDETSTLVGPGWRAFVNSLGYIEIIQEAA